MAKTRGQVLFAVLCTLSAGFVAAPLWSESERDKSIVTDENALFGDSSSGEAASSAGKEVSEGGTSLDDNLFSGTSNNGAPLVSEIESSSQLDANLLTTAGVEIGGSYRFSGRAVWRWDDPATIIENLDGPDAESASVDLGATIFFDARPDEDFRVFGKIAINYPFDSGGEEDRKFDDVFHVEELFSDVNWNEVLFLRGGKHALNWGVGYFFSPADILNVTEIDPGNPEADREGPVSIRTHLPFGVHNLYAYVIADDIDNWDDIGVASKVEFLIGSMELGIGASYRKDTAPSAMVTASFPLWDVDVFTEGVIRYGSDKTFLEESDAAPFGVVAVARDDELFYQATAGASYVYTFDEVDSLISVVAQYLYNGEGYKDPSILSNNAPGVGALIESGALRLSDLANPGRHYAAASATWSGVFGTDLGLRLFWIHNFSDMSGFVTPALTIDVFEGMIVSFEVPYRYGEVGDEYSPTGDSLSVTFQVDLGSGAF